MLVVVFKETFKCGLELQGEADPWDNSTNCSDSSTNAIELHYCRVRYAQIKKQKLLKCNDRIRGRNACIDILFIDR